MSYDTCTYYVSYICMYVWSLNTETPHVLARRGAWMCHRCAASGSWYDLKRRAGSGGGRLMSEAVVSPKTSGAQNAAGPRRTQRSPGFRPIPDQRRVGSYPVNLFHNPRFSEVKKYLMGTEQGQRGINEGVLIKYGVGCATYRCAVE